MRVNSRGVCVLVLMYNGRRRAGARWVHVCFVCARMRVCLCVYQEGGVQSCTRSSWVSGCVKKAGSVQVLVGSTHVCLCISGRRRAGARWVHERVCSRQAVCR
jgi:hypothetical protein